MKKNQEKELLTINLCFLLDKNDILSINNLMKYKKCIKRKDSKNMEQNKK
jgi:hypothetical protein